jgi:hypothetical protein
MTSNPGFYTSRMKNFHLRVATMDDVARIRELIEASVRGLQAGDYSAAQIEGALATVFTVDSQLIADGTYFVAVTDDAELAGCGGWSFRKTLYGGDHQVEKIAPEKARSYGGCCEGSGDLCASEVCADGVGEFDFVGGGACGSGAGFFKV